MFSTLGGLACFAVAHVAKKLGGFSSSQFWFILYDKTYVQ